MYSGVQIQGDGGGGGGFIPHKDFDPPPNKFMLPIPQKKVIIYSRDSALDSRHMLPSFQLLYSPSQKGEDDLFGLFGLKGVQVEGKNFGI